jgi:conserved oligomeric Golgi complex subunit 2
LLSRELLDLVNENYQDFLSLGNALHGGEEKAEEVRVGLLAFQRDVNAIRDKVEARRAEVEGLLGEKKQLRKDANIGQALLDVAERVEELEQRLMIGEKNGQGQREQSDEESDGFLGESDESESDDEQAPQSTAAAVSLKRLEHHIQKYVAITRLSARIGDEHPFLLNQQPRLNKIRSAVLHDLKAALEQAKNAGEKRDAKMLSVLGLYKLMGEDPSAITALKNLKL